MTEAPPTPVPPMGLLARAIGIITAPKATYENVVAAPRPFGILFIAALLIGIGSNVPQWTEEARKQTLEMQVRGMERFGMTVTPEAYSRLETQSRSPVARAAGVIWVFVLFPILALLLTAVLWALFNAILGGTASFKQVLAVSTHSYIITALGSIAAMPVLLYRFKMSMGGPFSLGALVPMLDDSSPVKRFLDGVNIFSLWGWVVLAIGLGVLYRRKSRGIAIGLLIVALLLTFAMTSFFGAFFGS